MGRDWRVRLAEAQASARRADREHRYQMDKLFCLIMGDSVEEHVTKGGKYFIARKKRVDG